MFSKSKINEPGPNQTTDTPVRDHAPQPSVPLTPATPDTAPAASATPRPPASILASDLVVQGDLKTTGDIQIEGTIEGDIRANLLTVGEGATVKGEVMADEVVVNGRVVGCVRGLKVRLTSTARVEGDIVHKTIAIESGAHFEGSVARREDPLKAAQASGPVPAPQEADAASNG